MKVFVTGGAGFIGHHLVRELLAQGHRVSVLDDFSTGFAWRLDRHAGAIDVVRGDTRDPGALDLAMASCEVVLHEAAVTSVARSVADPRLCNDVNTNGTIEVMLAASRLGVRRVVLAGSASVYGMAPGMPRRETQAPDPRSPYAASKVAAEHYVHTIGRLRGVETVVLRYFNVFGPGQDPKSQYAAAVPLFITAALRGGQPTVFGDGLQSRDFVYVDNVVSANILAATTDGISGLTCNIGCGGSHTVLDLLEAIYAEVGRPLIPTFADPRPGDVPFSQADISLAERHLGYRVLVPFEEGVRRTIRWYLENQGNRPS